VVGRDFLGDLERRLGLPHLYFAEPPTPILDGWETYIFRLRLGSRRGLPSALERPLILRIYVSAQGLPQLRHEYAAQIHMRRLGYPVAVPILCEERCELYDGPFMLMECLPGRRLLDLMLWQPWRIFNGPTQLAAEQVRLHQLPSDGFPEPPVPFPDNQLAEICRHMDLFELAGLTPGLTWLDRHKPTPLQRSILHLDFHPVNVMWHQGRCSGVVDWCESALGDREADVASSLVLMQTAPVEVTNYVRGFFALSGRWLLWGLYLHGYRCHLPLDKGRLSYYMALASLRRLARYGAWLRASPSATGFKPSSLHYINRHRINVLRKCFARQTGLSVNV
jgi:aminoglycoside phosphotransferase (APT) family kinase protein